MENIFLERYQCYECGFSFLVKYKKVDKDLICPLCKEEAHSVSSSNFEDIESSEEIYELLGCLFPRGSYDDELIEIIARMVMDSSTKTPIEYLKLNSIINDRLLKQGITYVEQLLTLKEEELMKVKELDTRLASKLEAILKEMEAAST